MNEENCLSYIRGQKIMLGEELQLRPQDLSRRRLYRPAPHPCLVIFRKAVLAKRIPIVEKT
jgi:hypothetical protein